MLQLALSDRDNLFLLEFVAEHLPICMFAKDCRDELRYVLWNKKMEDTYNINKTDVIGKRDLDFLNNDLALFALQEDNEMIMSGLPKVTQYSVSFNDKIHNFEKTKCLFRGSDGLPTLIIGFMEDLTTDIHNVELTRTLIGNFAHEIVERNSSYIKTAQELTASYKNDPSASVSD
jgi:PAS domain-containing protein